MSEVVKKPTVTKAGNAERKPEEVKTGFFSRRKKQKTVSLVANKKDETNKVTTEVKRAKADLMVTKKNAEKQTKQSSKKVHKKNRKPQRLGNKTVFVSLAALLLIVLGYGIISRGNNQSTGITLSDNTESALLGEQTGVPGLGEKPDFKVLIIKGVPSESQQYDAEIGAFFYRDELAGAVVRVNQQLLPPEFTSSPNIVKNLVLSREGVSSITQLETKKGPVYLGNYESGGQVAIFDFENLLLFIESTSRVTAEGWIEYINALSY